MGRTDDPRPPTEPRNGPAYRRDSERTGLWPVVRSKPRSRRLPLSRFHRSPPLMIGGLAPGSPEYPERTVVTVKLGLPLVLMCTALSADVHGMNTVLGAR